MTSILHLLCDRFNQVDSKVNALAIEYARFNSTVTNSEVLVALAATEDEVANGLVHINNTLESMKAEVRRTVRRRILTHAGVSLACAAAREEKYPRLCTRLNFSLECNFYSDLMFSPISARLQL